MKSSDFLVVRPGFCIAVSVAVLVLPLTFALSWLCAVIVHELGHLITLLLFRVPIKRITIDLRGASIESGAMTITEEFICTAAGPLAGLCILFLCRWIPYIAIFALIQNAYNLIPLPEHDGWRMLGCLLRYKLSPGSVTAILRAAEIFALVILSGFGIYASVHLGMDFSPILFALCLWIRYIVIKTPCNATNLIVQ